MLTLKKPTLEKNRIGTLLTYTAMVCVVNLIVFFVLNRLNFIHFEMNDDFTIQNLLNGSMGDHYIYFAHSNVVLSTVLSGLYRLTAAVNWYGVYLFIALLFSCSFTGAILIDKFNFKAGFALNLLLLPLLFGLILTNFTYTLICYAMLVCAVSCLVYGFYIQNRKTRRFLYILSIVMLVSSVLLRKEIIASALVYCLAVAALLLIRYKKNALRFCLVVLIGFAIIGGFTLIDRAYYNSTPELSEYLQFHEARIGLVDHEPLNYARDEYFLAEIGWTETDVSLYRDYYTYPDDAKFSTEKMEYIYSSMSETRYMTDGNAIFSNLISTFAGNNLLGCGIFILICLFASFAFAFVSQKKRLFKWFTVLLLLLPFLFQILFNMLYRTAPRAIYPHYMLSIITLLLFVDTDALLQKLGLPASGTRALASTLCLLVTVVAGIGIANLLITTKWEGEVTAQNPVVTETRQTFDAMYEDKEGVYLYPTTSPLLSAHNCYHIFDTFPEDYFKNNRLLGGWDTRSPSYNDFKQRYGLTSLPLDIVDNPDVYLVIPNADFLTAYFYTDHQLPVKYEVVRQIDSTIKIVRVLSASADEMGTVIEPDKT